jgi:hypothetical protein
MCASKLPVHIKSPGHCIVTGDCVCACVCECACVCVCVCMPMMFSCCGYICC